MQRQARRFCAAVGVCLIGLVGGAASAQTTSRSTEVKSFEILAVDGNRVVARTADGTREYTVPPDFRFNIGGKEVSVSEVKPGMKGTATITTTTTTRPVTVTEVRNAEVVQATGNSVLVRGPDGYRMFTEGDADKRGVTIMRDGRPIQFSELRANDRLTATIITAGPPQVLTERQVQASISGLPGAAAATTAARAAGTGGTTSAASSGASASAGGTASAARRLRRRPVPCLSPALSA